MRIIGAYMLCKLNGTEKPEAKDIIKILDAIGAKPDEEKLKLFMSQVEGKDLAEVIAAGSKKLGAMPGGAVGGGAPGGGEGGEGEAKKEEKKEEEEDDVIDFSDEDSDEE
mmetsp:Transcript_10123/g.15157  ORF Transcript_10123/g.15157 Transcript_10123/m.15157 type:complete len:110 (+) Transcript_10123:63-392(+)|eukprot:CAMPEP_0167749268 /NCGR_PEP_ID=MMETSP0110_2-20121227/5309_1 /TAXON_ID=629695 /ORGANISM="Gymnochlora sp., Strain CCMP2014" /LENGTH=109 /DNA_ID=CAMNT_0007634395 /DNA_START=46 /DNA_END=375 /DNA_ORIENTATION=-